MFLVYSVYVPQNTEVQFSFTIPSLIYDHWDSSRHPHLQRKIFILETSAVQNYLSHIFYLNTAATFTVQATDYRLALYFVM